MTATSSSPAAPAARDLTCSWRAACVPDRRSRPGAVSAGPSTSAGSGGRCSREQRKHNQGGLFDEQQGEGGAGPVCRCGRHDQAGQGRRAWPVRERPRRCRRVPRGRRDDPPLEGGWRTGGGGQQPGRHSSRHRQGGRRRPGDAGDQPSARQPARHFRMVLGTTRSCRVCTWTSRCVLAASSPSQ